MSLANSSKKRKMVELPDIGLAIAIGGFIAYAIYRWSQEPGASVILGLITTLLTFLIKICIYFYRIRLITNQLEKKIAQDALRREIDKLNQRQYLD